MWVTPHCSAGTPPRTPAAPLLPAYLLSRVCSGCAVTHAPIPTREQPTETAARLETHWHPPASTLTACLRPQLRDVRAALRGLPRPLRARRAGGARLQPARLHVRPRPTHAVRPAIRYVLESAACADACGAAQLCAWLLSRRAHRALAAQGGHFCVEVRTQSKQARSRRRASPHLCVSVRHAGLTRARAPARRRSLFKLLRFTCLHCFKLKLKQSVVRRLARLSLPFMWSPYSRIEHSSSRVCIVRDACGHACVHAKQGIVSARTTPHCQRRRRACCRAGICIVNTNPAVNPRQAPRRRTCTRGSSRCWRRGAWRRRWRRPSPAAAGARLARMGTAAAARPRTRPSPRWSSRRVRAGHCLVPVMCRGGDFVQWQRVHGRTLSSIPCVTSLKHGSETGSRWLCRSRNQGSAGSARRVE